MCSTAHQAFAQAETARHVGVLERSRPDYEALGGRVGSFLVFPKITAGVISDDNIFATETNEESDTLFTVQPAVQIASQWSRHYLGLSGGLNHTEYSDNGDESFTNYNFGGNGRVDVDRFTILKAAARYSRIAEPRTALASFQNVRRSVRYDNLNFNVGASKQFNKIRLNLDYDQADYNYHDVRDPLGAIVSQDYRDSTSRSVIGRVDYQISPDTFVFVKGVYEVEDFDLEPPAVVASRDSDGYQVTVGADFDLSNLLRGQVEVGYLDHEYDSPVFGSFSGLQVKGKVEYYPTQLTTVTLDGARTVRNSGDVSTAGYLLSAVGLQVDHELRRNIILTARGDYERAQFNGIDRDDDRYAVQLGGTYLVNRNVGVSLTYYYLQQRSNGLNRGTRFEDNRFMATTTLQY